MVSPQKYCIYARGVSPIELSSACNGDRQKGIGVTRIVIIVIGGRNRKIWVAACLALTIDWAPNHDK